MSLLPKPKKDLRTLTQLEKERELKRLQGETAEIIDEIGQESDRKAVKSVREYVNAQQQEETLQKNLDVEQLKQLSRNKIQYQRYLLVILNRFLKDEDISKKYNLFAESNDKGIVLGISGTEYLGAFEVCGIPMYDIHACKVLAVKLGNTVARLDGHFRQSDGGIMLANEAELQVVLGQQRHGRSS